MSLLSRSVVRAVRRSAPLAPPAPSAPASASAASAIRPSTRRQFSSHAAAKPAADGAHAEAELGSGMSNQVHRRGRRVNFHRRPQADVFILPISLSLSPLCEC